MLRKQQPPASPPKETQGGIEGAPKTAKPAEPEPKAKAVPVAKKTTVAPTGQQPVSKQPDAKSQVSEVLDKAKEEDAAKREAEQRAERELKAEQARQAYFLRERERKAEAAARDQAQKEAELKAREEALVAQARERETSQSTLKDAPPLEVIRRLAKERGMSEDDFMRAALTSFSAGGKATPEELVEQARREAKEEAARAAREAAEAVRKEFLEKEEREEREYREALAREEGSRKLAYYRKTYADGITAEAYPFLHDEHATSVLKALHAANAFVEKTGEVPDTKDLLDWLEKEAREEFMAKAERRKFIPVPEPVVVEETPIEPPREPAMSPDVAAFQKSLGLQAPVVRDGRGRFVTNSAAAMRGSDGPKDPRDMTPAERLKAAGSVIRKAQRANA